MAYASHPYIVLRYDYLLKSLLAIIQINGRVNDHISPQITLLSASNSYRALYLTSNVGRKSVLEEAA